MQTIELRVCNVYLNLPFVMSREDSKYLYWGGRGGVLTQITIGIPTTETATFDDEAGSK